MGFNKHNLELLLSENAYQRLQGKYLSLGKQTITIGRAECEELLRKYAVDEDTIRDLYAGNDLDTTTRHGRGHIYDHQLIEAVTDCQYSCLDVSEYEGADIIHDMNTPVSGSLVEQYDFIFNGSCLDNVFDPVTFLVNTSKMLKPGGRIIHNENSGSHPGAYLMLSSEWFFSYYSINNFTDCKVYALHANQPGKDRFTYGGDLFQWKPFYTPSANYSHSKAFESIKGMLHSIVIAEKGIDSTANIYPIQSQYLDQNCVDWRFKYNEYLKSMRPLVDLAYKKVGVCTPYLNDHYIYLGSYK